jgi:hypothetical protein
MVFLGAGVAVGATCASLGLGACAGRTDPPAPPPALTQDVREIPCDARRVLEVVCQGCHTAPPRNQAPFALVTYADTQVLVGGRPIWTYMRAVLENGAMPLPPVKIDPADRDTLIRWLDAGAPAGFASSACSPDVDSAAGSETEAGPLSSPGDEGAAARDAGAETSASERSAPDAPSKDAVDAGEEMAVAETLDAGPAVASDVIDTCCTNDGGAPSE